MNNINQIVTLRRSVVLRALSENKNPWQVGQAMGWPDYAVDRTLAGLRKLGIIDSQNRLTEDTARYLEKSVGALMLAEQSK